MRSTTRLAALAMLGLLGPECLAGCTSSDAGLSEGYTTVPPGHCAVDGTGAIAADVFGGAVTDGSGSVSGSWTHTTPGGDVLVADPDALVCRINGSRAANIDGRATWNGVPGYYFSILVQDLGGASPPARLHGTPEIVPLSATRTYSPSRWTDGNLSWEDGAEVVIPESLPVTVGNAGNQWARVTFVDYHSGEPIRCSYRGGASTANPRRPSDIAAGLEYEFAFCERWVCPEASEEDDDDDDGRHGRRGFWWGHGWGRDCDDDEEECDWERDSALVPGVSIDASSVEAHVQSGSSRFPDRCDAQTTITVELDVTPYILTPGLADIYTLRVFPPDAGPAIYSVSGDLTSGDLTVNLL